LGIFRRGKKEPDEDEQLARDIIVSEESQPAVMTEEYINSLGRSVFMIMDPDVTRLLDDEEKPAFSHLNRVTNIGQKEADLQMLDYEFLSLVDKMNSNEDEYEDKGWKKSLSKRIFARSIINDAFNGWKGKIVTEQIKVIRTQIEKKKKGLLF